jgi:hypothetical protein
MVSGDRIGAIAMTEPGTGSDLLAIRTTPWRQGEHNYELAIAWTLRNLDTAGYGLVTRDHLYLRDPNSTGSVADYKTAGRGDIESKGFKIIANIGDQYSDLANGHVEMTFNPISFISFRDGRRQDLARTLS